MDYSGLSYLDVSVQKHIATVTIQSGEHNTASFNLIDELQFVWRKIAVDDDVKAIVLTGQGKTFSAGGDIKRMADRAGTQEGFQHTLRMPAANRRIWVEMLAVDQPIVAVINGDAMGFGANLALFCDITVMSEEARIGDTHVKVGLVAGDGGAVIWPLLIGVSRAKDFLMRGRVIKGAEAVSMGLVNYASPPDRVLSDAQEIARELAALPKWAVRWTKLSINKHLQESLNLAFDASVAFEMLTMQTKDFGEATRAFVEKRKPQFKGE